MAPESKRKKVGRPTNSYQEQAFYKMCTYFEENDEGQLTITDLSNKMKEYLHDSDSSGYGNQYLKSSCKKNTTGILYLWLTVKGSIIFILFEKRQVAFYVITLRCQTGMTKKPRRELSLKLQQSLSKVISRLT